MAAQAPSAGSTTRPTPALAAPSRPATTSRRPPSRGRSRAPRRRPRCGPGACAARRSRPADAGFQIRLVGANDPRRRSRAPRRGPARRRASAARTVAIPRPGVRPQDQPSGAVGRRRGRRIDRCWRRRRRTDRSDPSAKRSTVTERRDVRPDDAFLAPVDQRTDLLPAAGAAALAGAADAAAAIVGEIGSSAAPTASASAGRGLGRSCGVATDVPPQATTRPVTRTAARNAPAAPPTDAAAAGRGHDSGDLPRPFARSPGRPRADRRPRPSRPRAGPTLGAEAERVEHGELVEQPHERRA